MLSTAPGRRFALVVAAASDGGIGKNGGLPWRLKGDMAFFKKVTSEAPAGLQNAVIMGRKTWDSIPPKFRPLPDRLNLVISRTLRQEDVPAGVQVVSSLESALSFLSLPPHDTKISEVFVIGGAAVYGDAIQSALCTTIYYTRVMGDFGCDAFFPKVDESVYELKEEGSAVEEGSIKYQFCTYQRR